jgi:dTDP-4-amino-4,6-dideoxygalactose transaminase
MAVGTKEGDEVIQPSLNFVASANMTRLAGAVPVFADIIDITEPTIDPADVQRRITERTKAVIVMHYGGYPCRMAEVLNLCRARGIAVIEDACHAVGGRYLSPDGQGPNGQAVGDLGDVAAFSFFGNKNLVTGEGGMLTTQSDDIAARIRSKRSHGMTTLTLDRHRGRAFAYDVVDFGFNYRPTEFMGALGSAQIAKLAELTQRRRAVAALYRQRLKDLAPNVTVPFGGPFDPQGATCHIFPVLLPTALNRSDVMQTMKERSVETSIHYRAVHTFSAYAHAVSSGLAKTEEYYRRTLTLPLYPKMNLSDVEYVCQALASATRK